MKVAKGAITQRMDSVLGGLEKEFDSLYDRKAFESKMDAVKRAGSKSDRSSKLRGLFDMFDRCGIPYEKGRENSYYEKLIRDTDMPTFTEIEDRMLEALFNRYEEYPSPEEYMKRIVDRLSSPEDRWQDDPLRLRILKQFLKYGDLSPIVGIGGRNTVNRYVKQKREALEQEALAREQSGEKAQEAAPQEKTPQKKKPPKKGAADKERAREEFYALLDDHVFDVLQDPDTKKEDKKPSGRYGILKIADDLAQGKFRAEGATKKDLYRFAMVYGMTYYTGIPGRDDFRDPATDIEKNLFQDYYSNNLMRYITDAYRESLSDFEVNPSGQGINFKNFAEVIYLYFIASDHTSRDKMRLSAEMIERVKNTQNKTGGQGLAVSSNRTLIYREMVGNNRQGLFAGTDIFSMSEKEFEDFICENYDCDTYVGSYTIRAGKRAGEEIEVSRGFMQQETEQATAASVYEEILKALPGRQETKPAAAAENQETRQAAAAENQKGNPVTDRIAPDRKGYGLWYTDIGAFGNKDLETFPDRHPRIDRDKFDEFLELLRAISKFVKDLPEPSPETVTRTSIITAYYYYYNAKHEEDGPDQWKNFKELYLDFERGVNEKLEAAYYQPLSGKNIFDVLVVFSSYAYMNL